jgi:DNA-binding transcriptional MerR regulator
MDDKKQNRNYTVKELAALAGITVRTLHLYDKIGLLKPSIRTEKKYRLYGKEELYRLQQILFYKELDFQLREIIDILDDPDFDLIKALEGHKHALASKKKRISDMLSTIDKTILNLKGKNTMTHEELYAGLPKEKAEQWQKEAKEKWPEQFAHSEKALMSMGKGAFQQLKADFMQNMERLTNLRNGDPKSTSVQKEIALHYGFIQKFWGKNGNIAEAYKGLGQLYVDEPSYTLVDGKPNKAFAVFMRDAMHHYADKNK